MTAGILRQVLFSWKLSALSSTRFWMVVRCGLSKASSSCRPAAAGLFVEKHALTQRAPFFKNIREGPEVDAASKQLLLLLCTARYERKQYPGLSRFYLLSVRIHRPSLSQNFGIFPRVRKKIDLSFPVSVIIVQRGRRGKRKYKEQSSRSHSLGSGEWGIKQ